MKTIALVMIMALALPAAGCKWAVVPIIITIGPDVIALLKGKDKSDKPPPEPPAKAPPEKLEPADPNIERPESP